MTCFGKKNPSPVDEPLQAEPPGLPPGQATRPRGQPVGLEGQEMEEMEERTEEEEEEAKGQREAIRGPPGGGWGW